MRVGLLVAIVLVASSVTVGAKPKAKKPTSVVFVIDRSGSMQGPKLETAKEAVLAAVDALGPRDVASLVVFDSQATVVFRDQPKSEKKSIEKLVAQVKAGGGTHYLPGLQQAFNILKDSKLRKHVILLSDGEAPTEGLAEVVAQMAKADITASAIGVEGADRNLLAIISEGGAGRLYLVGGILTLPKLFVKELDAVR